MSSGVRVPSEFAVHTVTLLQARAVDAAPQCGAPQRDEEV